MTNTATQSKGDDSPDTNAAIASRTVPVHFVRAASEDGENLDLLVCAMTQAAAIEIWRSHYELDADDAPEWLGTLAGVGSAAIGALDWEQIRAGT